MLDEFPFKRRTKIEQNRDYDSTLDSFFGALFAFRWIPGDRDRDEFSDASSCRRPHNCFGGAGKRRLGRFTERTDLFHV